tara:strand:- start:180 stop:3947 length:3768 start_codon:yes stop_codon:yes gene_type:complete
MAVDFPGSPTNGQVFSVGGASWRYNGYAWARIPDPGEKGQKGQKGEKGEKGQKGQQGDKGVQGNFGGATFDYTFSDATGTPTDLNTGRLRFNNSSVSSATIIFIDDEDDNGTDIQPFLRTIDDSTSTIKGHVRISNKLNADDFALFTISSASEQSGFHQISVGYVSGSASSFTNGEDIIVTFARTGDQGQKGEQGIQGVPGVQDKIFEGNTEAEVVDTGTDGHFKVTTEGDERFRITSSGQVTTRGATGTSFNNLGQPDFGSFLVVNGGHTQNEFGILSLEGNTNTSSKDVGNIQFVNQENSSSNSGLVATSRLVARIDARIETTDNNAGNDSGGFLRFITKPESAQVRESFRIGSSGQIGLSGANYGTSGQVLTSQGVSSAPIWDDLPASITYTLPDTGTDGTNFTDARGSATITLTGTDSTTDAVVITAGDNVKITNTGSGGFTINAQNTEGTNTTYDLVTANGDNANEEKIQLNGSDSTTDTVTLAVSTGLSIARDTTTGKITLTNTDTGSGSNTFIGLTDTPSSFTANKTLKVNSSGNAVIFADDNDTKYDLLVPSGTTKIRLEGTTESGNINDDVEIAAGTGISVTRDNANKLTIANTAPDTNTTYLLKAQQTGGNDTNPNLLLDASGSGTDDTVQLVGSGSVSVERNNDGQITITGTDTNTNTTYQLLATRQSNGGSSGTDSDPYLFLNASSGTDDSVRLVGSGSVSVERNNDGQITISGTDTNTNTTYDLVTSSSGSNVELLLDASAGDDDPILITAGTNVSFSSVSATGFTINTTATLTGTIDNAKNVLINTASDNVYKNIVFVDRDVSDGSYDRLRIDSQDDVLAYNPSLNRIKTTGIQLSRVYTSGGSAGTSGQLLTSGGGSGNFTWTNASSVGTDNYANSLSFSSGTLTLGRTGSLSDLTVSIPLSGITGDFTDLDDTPNDYNGDANKLVAVNNGNGTNGTGLTFVDPSSVGTDTNTTYDLLVPSGTTKIRLDPSDASGNDDIEIAGGTGITVTRNNANKLTITNSDTGSGANTTYDLSVPSGTTKLRLAGSNSTNDDVEIAGGSNVTVTRNNGNKLTISSTNTNTTYTAGGNYGMTLSGTEFRLKNDRRRQANEDVRSGNTHDYTFYDSSMGIRWYTATNEEMRLEDDGDLHVDRDIIAFSTTVSDIRLKKDLQIIQNPLDIINKINGYTFTYKKDDKKSAGVVAQEVEKVFPQAVSDKNLPFSSKDRENPDNYKIVEYDQIVGLLVQAVKELTDKVKKLESR